MESVFRWHLKNLQGAADDTLNIKPSFDCSYLSVETIEYIINIVETELSHNKKK